MNGDRLTRLGLIVREVVEVSTGDANAAVRAAADRIIRTVRQDGRDTTLRTAVDRLKNGRLSEAERIDAAREVERLLMQELR